MYYAVLRITEEAGSDLTQKAEMYQTENPGFPLNKDTN